MQERIDIDALIESLETPKIHKTKLKENSLAVEEWNARIEESQKFLKTKRKV